MEKENETSDEAVNDDGENIPTIRRSKEVAAPVPFAAVEPTSRQCKDWLTAYEKYTEDWEPPACFNRWTGLLTLSAATQRRVWLAEGNIQMYPNLFVVLVAPSGVGKTSAMREAIPFIETAIGAEYISPAKITAAKFLKRFAAARKVDAELGIISPYVIWAEELPSFLGLDAYKSGMIADLTTLYDCPPRWTKDTKDKGMDDIVAPYPCLMGGTTAQGIFDVLPPGAVTQGFTARLLFVHATYNAKRVVEKPFLAAKHEPIRQALLHDIAQISQLRGAARFSDIARTLWTDYYMSRPAAVDEFTDTRLQGYAARKPFFIKKLAVLCSVSENDTLVVEAHHVERAFACIAEIDKQLRQVYEAIAPSIVIQQYSKILAKLQRSRGGQLPRADLQRNFAYVLNSREFAEAMDSLEQMGFVEVTIEPHSSGRPRRVYQLTESGKKWT